MQDLKDFYQNYHDTIFNKRYHSPHPIRKQVHRDIYESVLQYISPGMEVLDAGCGEGVLSVLMAKKGARVTATDISRPNLEAIPKKMETMGVENNAIRLEWGDAESLPFPDNHFECVVSNHVLEHLPNFEKGLKEVYRVAKKSAVIAVPTCLNPSAWALLGGTSYYTRGKRALIGMPIGAARVAHALLTGRDGVNEKYAGKKAEVHVFRFPWIVKCLIRKTGFHIIDYQAQSLRLPHFELSLDTQKYQKKLRNFGLGTVFFVQK